MVKIYTVIFWASRKQEFSYDVASHNYITVAKSQTVVFQLMLV